MNKVHLDFNQLREANTKRLPLFRNNRGEVAHDKPDGSDWSPAQWLQAVVGEVGEYADLRKKYERGDISIDTFNTLAPKELADIVIYLDILSKQLGIDLAQAVMDKFNEVSKRVGCDIFLNGLPEAIADEQSTIRNNNGNLVKWANPACPRHVCQMFVVDLGGKWLLNHRSPFLRSARDVWSMPSETQKIGENTTACMIRGLEEEFSLEMKAVVPIGQYENIAGDFENPDGPQYHWVISLFAVQVEDCNKAINNEPDKHDRLAVVPLTYLIDDEFLQQYTFHRSLHTHLITMARTYYETICAYFYQ